MTTVDADIKNPKITACLVVYNEERVIEQCLRSLVGFVNEIIVVHDGDCHDRTLDIARRYTDKVFVRPHVGMMEGHLVFAFTQARSEWILRIDADEYLDEIGAKELRVLVNNPEISGIWCQWELWNGENPIHFRGLKKLCLFRVADSAYQGIPHASTQILRGRTVESSITLHHRPSYNNLSWNTARKKRQTWVPIHAQYFFVDQVSIATFNTSLDSWYKFTSYILSHPVRALIWQPLKMFLGQIKNGVWTSSAGLTIALQQYVYYLSLYWQVWQKHRQ
jgi:glycosyltransferase involved in cell wall biosynthesis